MILLFCQLWLDVAGFTVRAQDILTIVLLGIVFLVPAVLSLKITYLPGSLNWPIFLWGVAICFGVIITLIKPYSAVLKKDALVNAVRLILALSSFYLFYNYPISSRTKVRLVTRVIIVFSFLTTLVSLLQIGYWDGWSPLPLPSSLTSLAEGANIQRGREIFGLFLGDTGAHTWAGMLAMQALTVWLVAQKIRNQVMRIGAYGYFGILCLILLRVSVRNSILGIAIVIVGITLISSHYSRYLFNRFFWPTLTVLAVIAGVIFLMIIAPDSYFVERVRQILPQWERGSLVISRQSNIYGRLSFAEMALGMFRSSPLIGNGFYSFRELSASWSPSILGTTRVVDHAHNSYVQVLAELGLFGAAFLTWLLWRISAYLYATRKFLRGTHLHRFTWQLAAGNFIFILITAFFSNTFWFPYYMALSMIFLGLLASLQQETP